MTLGARRVEGLDAIRGLAVLLVMLTHAWPDVFPGAGIVGVTIFFALSGFLITGVLDRNLRRSESIDFRRFYVHRALRLFPAVGALLVIYALVESILHPVSESVSTVVLSVVLGATYTANLITPGHMSIVLDHLWSLATEEQFYLVWPALLLFTRRWGKPVLVCVISAAGLILLCWASALIATNPGSIYKLPTTWGSSLVVGAIGYYMRDAVTQKASPSLLKAAGVIGLLVSAALWFVPDAKFSVLTYFVWPTLVPVCAVAMIYVAIRWQQLPTSALKPFLMLGTISYAAYLWNIPVNVWMRSVLGDDTQHWIVFTIPLTIAAATLSWFTVEKAGRTWRERYDDRAALPAEPAVPQPRHSR